MKSIAILLLSLCALSSCAAPVHPVTVTGPLPGGAVSRGTLASSDLISEAGKNITAAMQASGYSVPSDLPFSPYLIKAPSGPEGSIRWQEEWFFHVGSEEVPVVIDFQQTSASGTDMNIHVPQRKGH